jgi:hypothetical protein
MKNLFHYNLKESRRNANTLKRRVEERKGKLLFRTDRATDATARKAVLMPPAALAFSCRETFKTH